MDWRQAVERAVGALGYDVIDVERSAGALLRVYIDRVPGRHYDSGDGDAVTVDDCELVTRQLQYALQVEGVDYQRLEVSSPGLDRPLRRPADWQRFAGSEVDLTLRLPFQGRRKWRGTLAAGDDHGWRLVLPAQPEAPKAPGVGKAPKAPGVKGPEPKAPAAAQAPQALEFELDEVREARLVPQIDFKRGPSGAAGRGTSKPPAQEEGRKARQQR